MRKFSSTPKRGLLAALVLIGIVSVVAFSGASNAATRLPGSSLPLSPSDSGPTPTTLAPSDASGTYGGTTTLTATLTADGSGVAGESVEFTLNGFDLGGATTGGNGVAELDNVNLAGIDAGFYPAGVDASFAGDEAYQSSDGTSSLTVSQADQSIVIDTHAPADAVYGDQFTVDATGGDSGNDVVYGSSGSCTNSGPDFTMTGSGQCTISYDQPGDTNYNDAPELTEIVNGHKADQTIQITSDAPASAAYGTEFDVSATGGGSGNDVTYGSSGGCTNVDGHFTMTSGNTDCVVTYDQAGDDNYNPAEQQTETVTAQKADQTIDVTTDAPGSAVYGSQFDVAADAPGGPVSYSSAGGCTNTDGSFTMTSGTDTCTVQFDQAGDDDYNPAPTVTEYVEAAKLDQTITFDQPADMTYGDPEFDPGATASSGYPVSYQASGQCVMDGGMVEITGAGSCTVTASQDGDDYYNAAEPVEQTFSIDPAPLTITADDQQKLYGEDVSLGTTAFHTSALVGSESVSSVTLWSDGAAAGGAPGDHPIVPSDAVAGPDTDLDNYDITYVDGNLHVSPVGIVGLEGVTIGTKHGIVNSFDSTFGPFSQSNRGSGALAMSNGPISVNGVSFAGGLISTLGSVYVGPKGSLTGGITAGSAITVDGTVGGGLQPNFPTQTLEAPAVGGCQVYSDGKGISGGVSTFKYSAETGNLTVKNGTVWLAPGTYCFHKVTVVSNAHLQATGPVKLELSGRFLSVKGYLVNKTGNPRNFDIETTYEGANGVRAEGGPDAYVTITAPYTSVRLTHGAFFGSVLGDTVRLAGHVRFHADLRGESPPT